MVATWVKWLARGQGKDVWEAWSLMVARVAAKQWGGVSGPVGALIATLTGYGWEVPSPVRWTSPKGLVFVISKKGSLVSLLREVEESVTNALWRKAAEGYCGVGLGDGPHDCSFRQLHILRAGGDHVSAGILECILTAGFWFPDRTAAAFGSSDACRRCGVSPCGPWHTFWGCSGNADLQDPHVKNTQDLIIEAMGGGG